VKRIVIPVENNKLSENFSKCAYYLVVEIYKEHISKKEIDRTELQEKVDLTNWLLNTEVSDIISYKIDNEIIEPILNTKINLFLGIAIDTPQRLIENYLSGNLTSNTKLINTSKKAITNNI
jgi:predicted Fe-Mo cluster-binding NifX family protein